VAKIKKRKLLISANQENSRPAFLLNLKEEKNKNSNQDKGEDQLDFAWQVDFFSKQAKKKVRNYNFLKKLFKQNKKKESWSFRFKSLFILSKKSKSSIKYKILFFRKKPKIWQKKLDQFSKVANNLNSPIKSPRLVDQKKIEEKEKDFILKINWYRRISSFLLVLILLIIPFKVLDYFNLINLSSLEDRVLIHSEAAINNLMLASDSVSQLNLEQAQENFSLASQNFISAQAEIDHLNTWLLNLAALSNNPKAKLASESKNILLAGQATAQLGNNFSLAFDGLFNSSEKDWSLVIDNFLNYSVLALADIKDLKKYLVNINKNFLPLEYQGQFDDWRNKIISLESSLSSVIGSVSEIKDFLGFTYDRRYLLIFQNNTEMRGSGGFMGSYALLDLKKGGIKNLEVPSGGTYDTEAGMKNFIKSPRPLWLVNPRWFFWDANWWPDWPTTAKNLIWFYEKSDGPTVDGVISFTPDVLAGLLEITGPINLQEEYGIIIDKDNFWLTIQSITEKDNLIISHPSFAQEFPDSPANQPKKIIGDLMNELLEVLPEKITIESLPTLLDILEKNRREKNILFYFSDDDLQKKIEEWRLDGSIKSAKHDYLMVTHTNIAGQKSDKEIEEKVLLDTQILSDGRIINELTIIRKHQGEKNAPFTGVRNVDWLRVYVPKNSRLIKANGFSQPELKYFEFPENDWLSHPFLAENEELAIIDKETGVNIYLENDKTVFANWVMTDPGETSIIKIRYQLPFLFKSVKRDRNHLDFLNHLLNIDSAKPTIHSLLLQKQPGLKNIEFFSRLRIPDSFKFEWSYPAGVNSDKNDWSINTLLDGDKFFSILALPK
jgi:hypothetical protein